MRCKLLASWCCVLTISFNVTAEDDSDKLLLAAKKIRRATSTDFVISLVADDFSRASNKYVGKLRHVFFLYSFRWLCCFYFLCITTICETIQPGLTLLAQSLPFMIANFQLMLQFIKVDQVEDSTQSKCLQDYLHVTTAWQPFPMNWMFFAPEDPGGCIVSWTQFQFLQFRRAAVLQHLCHFHCRLMTSPLIHHLSLKERRQ